MKTRISAPAHPSATGIGRVSGLVIISLYIALDFFSLAFFSYLSLFYSLFILVFLLFLIEIYFYS